MLVSIGVGIVGCEWESPDSDESWSDSYNWINFSGVYKNPSGGSVVTDYTSSVVPATNTAGSTAVSVGPVTIAFGDGGNSYSGRLLANVVPGSLQITAGGVVFTDNGTGGLTPTSGDASISGSISYDSGAWNIDLGGLIIPSGEVITATYSVFQTAGGTIGTPGSNNSKKHGTTGTQILSFNVMQEGNLITLIDSDGMHYAGKLGSVRSASGDTGPDGNTLGPRVGDVVVAQFTCNGTSRVGLPVEIVGVLQGTITAGGVNTFVMSARNIQGQWIEKVAGGKTGDVIGVAKDAAINWTYTGSVSL
jgi:hypothetical protein